MLLAVIIQPANAESVPGLYTYNGSSTASTPQAACEQLGSIGSYRVYWQFTGVPFTDCPIQGPWYPYLTGGADLGGECLLWIYNCDVRHLRPTISCSTNSTLSNSACTCNEGYAPDSAGTSCVPVDQCQPPDVIDPSTGQCVRCPIDPLTPLDPAMQPYEDGLVDMENATQATRDGAACIVRSARAHRPRINATLVSGYRPQAYQTHIREVYDKWQLLENNNGAECADVKSQIKTEYDHHGPFAHQPGNTSRHSTGRAVDISLTNYADADTIAAGCVVTGGGAMSRPVANDRSHFESPR